MRDLIVQSDAPVLRAISKPVSIQDISSRRVKMLIAKMKKALKTEKHGVAIAAPQVGESVQIFVVAGKVFQRDSASKDAPTLPDKIFINPEIIRASRKKQEMSEGCLSVRGVYGSVPRHEKVTLKAIDELGRPLTYHASGLLAHIFQHEVDHLHGILFTDKASRLEDWKEHD